MLMSVGMRGEFLRLSGLRSLCRGRLSGSTGVAALVRMRVVALMTMRMLALVGVRVLALVRVGMLALMRVGMRVPVRMRMAVTVFVGVSVEEFSPGGAGPNQSHSDSRHQKP